jgi:hypothetical protein
MWHIYKKRIGQKQLTCKSSILGPCTLVYNVFLEKLIFFLSYLSCVSNIPINMIKTFKDRQLSSKVEKLKTGRILL